MTATTLLASSWSLHLPAASLAGGLTARLGRPVGDWASAPAADPAEAATVLGRKGLLYKEPATRLALCAVHRALGLPLGSHQRTPVEPGTAVIAASNLGNVETVARVVRSVDAEGGKSVSVLDAPNVSSNIIASAVALWFGFGGPNLMLCSGADAGLDGLLLASLLLRARRADRVVLVGVEPADEVARALYLGGLPDTGDRSSLQNGAACLVLQRDEPGAPAGGVLVRLPGSEPGSGQDSGQGSQPDREQRDPDGLQLGPDGFDPVAEWGDRYGAQGIVSLALAAHLVADEGLPYVSVQGGHELGRGGHAVVSATEGKAA